ncbi:hypothetical protein F5X96DRAFT_557032 [Biscogniauxia mediterranea]|nr:hypothetical protein F5X96DRAFT_557032 [Biscogniauxia mediterranea]
MLLLLLWFRAEAGGRVSGSPWVGVGVGVGVWCFLYVVGELGLGLGDCWGGRFVYLVRGIWRVCLWRKIEFFFVCCPFFLVKKLGFGLKLEMRFSDCESDETVGRTMLLCQSTIPRNLVRALLPTLYIIAHNGV